MGLEEIIALIVKAAGKAVMDDPALKTFVEAMALKVGLKCFATIWNRHAADPSFQQKANPVFAQIAAAKTDQEEADALKAYNDLILPSA